MTLDVAKHIREHAALNIHNTFKVTTDGTYFYLWIQGVKFMRINPTTKNIAIEGDIWTNESL